MDYILTNQQKNLYLNKSTKTKLHVLGRYETSMGSARAVTMCGTLDGMEHGQKLTVFLTNNLFLSLHEGTVTPRSLSLSVTVTVTLQYVMTRILPW